MLNCNSIFCIHVTLFFVLFNFFLQDPGQEGGPLAVRDETETPMSPELMDGQDWSWLLLVALFLASLLVVLTWLVQYSLAILRPRRSGTRTHIRSDTHWQLPLNLTHQTLTGGVWGSLLRLRFARGGGGSETEAGVKGLLSSLFSFKSFREHWQRAWVRALNEQASRQGVSLSQSIMIIYCHSCCQLLAYNEDFKLLRNPSEIPSKLPWLPA